MVLLCDMGMRCSQCKQRGGSLNKTCPRADSVAVKPERACLFALFKARLPGRLICKVMSVRFLCVQTDVIQAQAALDVLTSHEAQSLDFHLHGELYVKEWVTRASYLATSPITVNGLIRAGFELPEDFVDVGTEFTMTRPARVG